MFPSIADMGETPQFETLNKASTKSTTKTWVASVVREVGIYLFIILTLASGNIPS